MARAPGASSLTYKTSPRPPPNPTTSGSSVSQGSVSSHPLPKNHPHGPTRHPTRHPRAKEGHSNSAKERPRWAWFVSRAAVRQTASPGLRPAAFRIHGVTGIVPGPVNGARNAILTGVSSGEVGPDLAQAAKQGSTANNKIAETLTPNANSVPLFILIAS